MKFQIVIVTLFLLFCSITSAKITSKQLFENLDKSKHKIDNIKKSSKFGDKDQVKKSSSNSISNKELFDSTNFNQLNEKPLTQLSEKMNEIPLLSNVTESIPNIGKNLETENEKAINDLEKQIESLSETNNDLMKKIKVITKNSRGKIEFKQELDSFMRKYYQDISNLKNDISFNQNLVNKNLNQNDQEFQNIYDKTSNSLNTLQQKVLEINNVILKLKSKETKKLNEIHFNLNMKNLSIEDKLNVIGRSFVNKINTNKIDSGKIQIESDSIVIGEKSKLIIGKDSFNIDSFMKSLKSFTNIFQKCGQNFIKCKVVPQKELKEHQMRQKQIVEKMKKLREVTHSAFLRDH